MMDKYSTRATPKDTEERMVCHMSCDTTQHRALETTFCLGWLMKCQQTNHGGESRCTSRREPSHLLFLSIRLDLRHRPSQRCCQTRPCLSLFSDPPLRADLHRPCACFNDRLGSRKLSASTNPSPIGEYVSDV